MSYVDEVYERVVRENPSQPEFHQAACPSAAARAAAISIRRARAIAR